MAVDGLPASCRVRIARDSTEAIGTLAFEPCPDRPSCRQLVADWEPSPDGELLKISDLTGYHDGTRGYFSFFRSDPSGSGLVAVVATDAGEIVAAWSYPPPPSTGDGCIFGGGMIQIGEGMFAVPVIAGAGGLLEMWILGGSLGDPAGSIRVVHHWAPAGRSSYFNAIATGADQIAIQMTTYELFRLDWAGTLTPVRDSGGAPLQGNAIDVVDRAIVFDHGFTERQTTQISIDGGPAASLVDPSDATAEAATHGRTDGRTLAWLQGYNRDRGDPIRFARIEVWASPFATRSAELAAVRVGDFRSSTINPYVHGGHGHVAVWDDPPAGSIRLIRVADLHESTLDPPPGFQWTAFVSYIGPREVLVSAGDSPARSSVVQLIDYSALEPAL